MKPCLIFLLAICIRADQPDAALEPARAARDSGDAVSLRKGLAHWRQDASFDGRRRTALLNFWLCEALYASNDEKSVKLAARAGLDAAEQAVKLQPNSSEAHRLVGDLLGQLIPHVFAGGMRYGARSTQEIEKALELDPKNVDAHIARATSYFFTPSAFGGSKEKALEQLNQALAFDPKSDTAHLWLAQVYDDIKQRERAVAELEEARRINPNRAYTRYLATQIGGAK
ncbi:MAG TPA: tetratricopeptide repeat protein [Bryobacteraceae bacterium]